MNWPKSWPMGEYDQSSSPSDLHDKSQEENVIEEPHAKETGVEREAAQEMTEPVSVPAPEQPEKNNEETPQKEDTGTSHSPGHNGQPAVPSKEILEIKGL